MCALWPSFLFLLSCFFLFEWGCFHLELTKITETFMKEISCTSSQLFRNDEYLTEKTLSLLLAQGHDSSRLFVPQGTCFLPIRRKKYVGKWRQHTLKCVLPVPRLLQSDGISFILSSSNSLNFTQFKYTKWEKPGYSYVLKDVTNFQTSSPH